MRSNAQQRGRSTCGAGFGRVRDLSRTMLIAMAGVALWPACASADDAWGFEQVTPVNKGAGIPHPLNTFRPSADGTKFLYSATAPFAGVPTEAGPLYTRYLGVRGPTGWENRAQDVPLAPEMADRHYVMSVAGASKDLTHVVVASLRALAPGAVEGRGNLYMRDTADGSMTLIATDVTPTPGYDSLAYTTTGLSGAGYVLYVGPDGRSAVFISYQSLVPGAPVSGATYAWSVDGGLKAVSVLPSGEIVSPASGYRENETGPRDSGPHEGGTDHFYFADSGGEQAVYVRSGSETRVVSWSRDGGSPASPVPAKVDAVGDGGRFMVFHPTSSDVQLTSDAPYNTDPTTRRLYRYEFATDDIEYIGDLSSSAATGGAGVQQMSQDGQTVAFQSTLAFGPAPPGAAGRTNMYVWRHGTLRYVATADAGSTRTNTARFERILSENGRYLTFTDNSSALAATFGVANNVALQCYAYTTTAVRNCTQVYRFDADANDGAGKLDCVSCQPGPDAPQGDAGAPGLGLGPAYIRMDGHVRQSVSNDGTVFFTSAEDRLPQDSNGSNDVYAWREGQLRLVSRGTQGAEARFLDATPDGKSVFIGTDDPIVPTDTDRSDDVYVTREGAGFEYSPPAVTTPCSGGDCRTGSQFPGQVLGPRSDSPSVPGTNQVSRSAPTKIRIRSVDVRRGRLLRVEVDASHAGQIRLSGAAVRTSTRRGRRAGRYSVSVVLTSKTQKRLRKQGRLGIRLRASLAPPFGRPAVATARRIVRK